MSFDNHFQDWNSPFWVNGFSIWKKSWAPDFALINDNLSQDWLFCRDYMRVNSFTSIFYLLHLCIYKASQPGPRIARVKKYRDTHLSIFVTKSFLSSNVLRFWSLGDLGDRGTGFQGQTCVKNLPWELVERSVPNLVVIGLTVLAWLDDIGTSSQVLYIWIG